ncbi:MAG: hypothetical protein IJ299_05425 [Oscillospiraceae bacterium]|nr:hypothetical protein [Oscillospiraceae bacterium]
MSDKKLNLPKISLPNITPEKRREALLSGAAIAAVCASCAILLSGINLLFGTVLKSDDAPSASGEVTQIEENTVMPSDGEGAEVK